MYFSNPVLIVGFLLIGIQFLAAYKDSFLTVSQMKKKGFSKGLPLLYHAGVWGDVILTPILAYIVGTHSAEWNISSIVVSLVIGVVLIIVMGCLWVVSAKRGLPEAHTYEGKMMIAGYAHAVYFAGAIAEIVLFFIFSKITRAESHIIAAILGFRVLYGTHVFLGIAAPEWYTNRPQKDPVTWTIIAVSWIALAIAAELTPSEIYWGAIAVLFAGAVYVINFFMKRMNLVDLILKAPVVVGMLVLAVAAGIIVIVDKIFAIAFHKYGITTFTEIAKFFMR